MPADSEAPHLPRIAPIDAYGGGGFRFAGMSHRGSILCVPTGIWAWAVAHPYEIDDAALDPVFAAGRDIRLFLLGTGRDPWIMPESLLWRFRDHRIAVEVTSTGAAVRTWNVLMPEGRPVAAGLIAVD
jgi:uncharacterized protein